jgi:hypothetical protein
MITADGVPEWTEGSSPMPCISLNAAAEKTAESTGNVERLDKRPVLCIQKPIPERLPGLVVSFFRLNKKHLAGYAYLSGC